MLDGHMDVSSELAMVDMVIAQKGTQREGVPFKQRDIRRTKDRFWCQSIWFSLKNRPSLLISVTISVGGKLVITERLIVLDITKPIDIDKILLGNSYPASDESLHESRRGLVDRKRLAADIMIDGERALTGALRQIVRNARAYPREFEKKIRSLENQLDHTF